MRPWLQLSGYPLIHVSRLPTGELSFAQTRFLIHPSEDTDSYHVSSRCVLIFAFTTNCSILCLHVVLCGASSRWAWLAVIDFLFQRFTCTRWEAPGGFWASSSLWLANCFPSVLWCCWFGLLTCKTVSRMTVCCVVGGVNPDRSYMSVSENRWIFDEVINL